MFVTTDKPDQAESGLAALVLLLRFHGIGANPEQIGHRFDGNIGVQEMLLCAREFGLKARAYRSNWQRLSKTPLPGIAVLRDGRFLILGKAGAGPEFSFKIPCCPVPSSCLVRNSRRSGMAELC